MRLAVPDLVSPSYFPALAAVELGLARDEGVDLEWELRFPVTDAAAALRAGEIDFLAGAAHAPMHAFPGWRGAKLVTALSSGMYWFLVVRADLGIGRGDLASLRDVRLGAAPGPDLGLRLMLEDAGIDVAQRGISIGPVPVMFGAGTSFGLAAAQALAAGLVDGFWANGMGSEIAVLGGVGTVVVDARRDGYGGYTFPALAVTSSLISRSPGAVAAVARSIVRAQQVLRADPSRAAEVGRRLFPEREASLIAELIRRDAPFYDPGISSDAVAGLLSSGRRAGLLDGEGSLDYQDVVDESVVLNSTSL